MKFSVSAALLVLGLSSITAQAQDVASAGSESVYLIDSGDVYDFETADIETIAMERTVEIVEGSEILSDEDKEALIAEILAEHNRFLEDVVAAVQVRRTFAKRDLTFTRNVGISAMVAPVDPGEPGIGDCPPEILEAKRDLTFTRNVGISAHIDAGR